MNGLGNQDFLGVAMVGSGDRAVVHQSSERRPVCHQRQSGPTPNEAIHCRSKAPKAERSAVGKTERSAVGSQLTTAYPVLHEAALNARGRVGIGPRDLAPAV